MRTDRHCKVPARVLPFFDIRNKTAGFSQKIQQNAAISCFFYPSDMLRRPVGHGKKIWNCGAKIVLLRRFLHFTVICAKIATEKKT